MSKILDFYNRLEEFRQSPSDDPYEDRITHCIMTHQYKEKEHNFEVRGWGKVIDEKIDVHAVNWTLCAGYCTISLDNENVDKFALKKYY